MARVPCAICGRSKDEEAMRIIETTAEERVQLKKMGETSPQERYAYCRSCISVLENLSTATSYFKGIIQVHARAKGVPAPAAERAANRFANQLLQKGLKPKV